MQFKLRQKKYINILVAVLGLAVSAAYSQTYPAPAANAGPASFSGSFPAGFASFNPPVSGSPSASAPEIYEWTRSNKAGDSMALTGERLSSLSGGSAGTDSAFVVYGESATASQLSAGTVLQLEGVHAAVKLPSNLPDNAIHLMWPKNANGYGRPVIINKAEAWWSGPKRPSKGATVSVFGRNLVADESAPVSYAFVEETGTWLTSASANPYKADFVVPSNWANGSYTLWLHNGLGQQYGWARSVSVEVANDFSWDDNSATWINVKSAPYNAKGDGSTDDGAAIVAAVSDCPAGGTVYFPEGTYMMGEDIWNVFGNKRLLGAGMNLTKLTTHSRFQNESSARGIIHSTMSNVEIKDMEFHSGNFPKGALVRARTANNLLFTNVRFSNLDAPVSGYEGVVDISFSDNVQFRECEFIADNNFYARSMRDLLIKDCDFYGVYECNKLIALDGSDNVIITGTTGQNYDNSDYTDGSTWCQGRFVNGSGNGGAMRNWYLADNTSTDMCPRYNFDKSQYGGEQIDQNTGEQFMWEHLRTIFKGASVGAGSDSVSVSGLGTDMTGMNIVISEGRGFGQSRSITGTSGNTVTVDEPWHVIPDSSSVLMIGKYASRIVVYNNTLDGTTRAFTPHPSGGSQNYTASAGVNFYGGFQDSIVAKNNIQEVRAGLIQFSLGELTVPSGANTIQPNFFNAFVNNSLTDVGTGIGNIAMTFKSGPYDDDTATAGIVWRQNYINNAQTVGIVAAQTHEEYVLDLSIYDRNVVTNTDEVVEASPLAQNQVFVEPTEVDIVSPPLPPVPEPPPTNAPLDRIEVSGPVSVDEGGSAQFVGTGFYVDGTSEVLDVEWSENSASASISPSGLFTAGDVASDEVVSVTAVYGSHSDSANITVSYVPPVLENIEISGPATVLEGGVASYSCVAHYSDGSVLGINPSWSDNSGLASISSAGQLSAGDVTSDVNITVTASFGGKSDTHAVTIQYIPPTLASLTILGPFSVDEESSASYTSVASFSDGTTATVTPVWSVNSSDASINASGTLTTGDVSSDKGISISASYSGVSANLPVTINFVPPYIVGLEIVGLDRVAEESASQYICESIYSDGARETIVPVWSVLAGSASIDASGVLATGNVAGDQSATIQAAFDGKTDTFDVTILYVAPTVVGLTISGPTVIEAGTTASYLCTANYSDGTTGVINPAWSDDASFANISASGVLSAGTVAADQLLAITASVGGVQAGYAVTVLYVAPPVVLSSLSISAPASINENATATLVCNAIYSDGSQVAVSPVWITDSDVATIDSNGVLSTGNVDANSTITVSASYNGQVAAHTLDVWSVGNQIIYPLTGFDDKTVKARLWDETGGVWVELGQMVSPQELVVENVAAGQWYMVAVEELNNVTGEWTLVHTSWVSM